MITSTKSSIFNYALLTFIILWSGGGFTYGLFPYWMLYALPVVAIAFFSNGNKFSTHDWRVIIILSAVLILQLIKFSGAPISILSPILIIIICMMAAHLFRNNFTSMFVNIIYFFAFSSLVLWFINLVPAGHSIIDSVARGLPQLGWENLSDMESNSVNNSRSVYLFTISDHENILPRNHGPFWEPGRFTIYLALALAINLFYNNDKLTSKKSLILLAADITTFSTTGYSAIAIILMVLILGNKRIKTYQKALLAILLTISAIYVWQLDFMADKIQEQSSQLDVAYSRFGAIYYHWTQIVESPLIGFGPYLSTSFMDLEISPNGLTDLIRYYGIPVALFLYVLLYRGTMVYISSQNSMFRMGVFLSVLVLCFSQTITYSPFFYILYFFGSNNTQYETYK